MDNYVCQYCGKVCKNPNSLRNHERLCKNNPNKDLNPYELALLKGTVHRPFKERKSIHKIGEEIAHDEYQYQCPVCGKYFTQNGIGSHTYTCRKVHGTSKDDELYKLNSSITLDVTNKEIKEYQEKVTTCEICGRTAEEANKYTGKYARKNLCVDHNHITGKFRGLLCTQCNRALGWYENNKNKIENYLIRGSLM